MKKLALPLIASISALALSACAPSTLSTEAAGTKYLEIVCPGNEAMNAYVAAMLGENLEMIHNSAQALKDEYTAEIKEFEQTQDSWPDSVREDMTVISDANETIIAALDKILAAKSIEDARVKLPELPQVSEAVSSIRSELGLSSNSAESCKSINNKQ